MIHLGDNGKINFIINSYHGYDRTLTGGTEAFHTLAYLLAKEGQNVYVFCENEYPHPNIHVLKGEFHDAEGASGGWEDKKTSYFSYEPFTYTIHNTVSIYSQIDMGHPYNTKHVARWVMQDGFKEIEDSWLDTDYYFNFGDYFKKPSKGIYGGNLATSNFHFDIFKDHKKEDRKGYCHIWHKHTSENAPQIVEKYNSVDVSDWKGKGAWAYLAEQFNKYEYFLTYDQKTIYTLYAALCGCTPIIVDPNTNENSYYRKDMTPIEYRTEDPAQLFGVAWGFEDLKWAEDTKHLVRDYLIEYDNQIQQKTVRDFIKFWENKCYEKR